MSGSSLSLTVLRLHVMEKFRKCVRHDRDVVNHFLLGLSYNVRMSDVQKVHQKLIMLACHR